MADAAVSKTAEGDLVWVRLPPSAPADGVEVFVGAWLSLVERRVRVAEVGGSNPLAPTNLAVNTAWYVQTTRPSFFGLYCGQRGVRGVAPPEKPTRTL